MTKFTVGQRVKAVSVVGEVTNVTETEFYETVYRVETADGEAYFLLASELEPAATPPAANPQAALTQALEALKPFADYYALYLKEKTEYPIEFQAYLFYRVKEDRIEAHASRLYDVYRRLLTESEETA